MRVAREFDPDIFPFALTSLSAIDQYDEDDHTPYYYLPFSESSWLLFDDDEAQLNLPFVKDALRIMFATI
ncbi:hypothetical protein LTR95_000605 [Oleoguttula sp. CCFEE 5521]